VEIAWVLGWTYGEAEGMKHIGFTGTQVGLTPNQKGELANIFEDLYKEDEDLWLHHGLCIGADAKAHYLFKKYAPKGKIIGHPPLNKSKVYPFDITDFEDIFSPKAYLMRNQDIVNCVTLLIVCPKTNKEELRSGTWATYRYAKKRMIGGENWPKQRVIFP
jgi:hypothetical protein